MLDGVTILDLSTVGPGSRCTALLRDLGARITKIAAPSGRIVPPAWAYGGGRNVETVEIDLKRDAQAFLDLARDADVIVESYRPGVAARLGIGYDDVKRVNERIVYAAITGYGQTGEYAQRAGHDINYLAVGGYLGCQGRDADGKPALPGATVADSAGGGMQAAIAICAALYRRERAGEGAFLDVSTTNGVLSIMSLFVDQFVATGVETGPGTDLLTGRYACYGVYTTRDGRHVSVGAIEPKFFANLCAALGVEQLAEHQMDDARQPEIRAAFAEAFETRTRDEWTAALADADTCVAPVLSIGEVAAWSRQ